MDESVCLDFKCSEIITDLIDQARGSAKKSVLEILNISSDYLSREAHRDLMEFYKLYFENTSYPKEKTERINKEVDELFNKAKELADKGANKAEMMEGVKENSEAMKERISLSWLQKKLESLIYLEEGLKEKLAPILSSMQFEDATHQRLCHIDYGVKEIIIALKSDFASQVEELSLSIENNITSIGERKLFYELVKKEEAPKGGEERGVWVEF